MHKSLLEAWESHVPDRKPGGCWQWHGRLTSVGYGQFRYDNKLRSAHRTAYELLVGPIPIGFVIDHLCHNSDGSCHRNSECQHRSCVNPEHLDAVSYATNRRTGKATEAKLRSLQQKTHCPRGHELTPENTYSVSRCKECRRDQDSTARQARRGPVTERCEFVSHLGNPCQRQNGHEGRHHGEKPRYRVTLQPDAN
ncbi:HNH endonuclease signature motif containing protein [Leucobacter japonicus]|uniref:HNH endonuclease signature motif containing protein n=1 Tax=Leucobacter japonicus TaxID=1461259 RepID=UPI0009495523